MLEFLFRVNATYEEMMGMTEELLLLHGQRIHWGTPPDLSGKELDLLPLEEDRFFQ